MRFWCGDTDKLQQTPAMSSVTEQYISNYTLVSAIELCVCVSVCVRACVHTCIRACMRACVRL